ncbi:three-Cys-motif partner protein TcmP [Mesorhizobium sp. M0296]|uniref:three-Cys-motif partner protein TcmP n=1 Tax=Mesorhizobium sp. M0296 TaxID=2956931 RepID=UPI003338AFC4
MSVYRDREQTQAKHIILRKYLQTLAFKLLHGGHRTLTYVDGFSGPWESQTADYSDTSFMIAINVLKDVQKQMLAQGKRKVIRCFFVEEKASSYSKLEEIVMKHHDPANDFYVHTFHGRFEDAVDEIMKVVGMSFALTFIDPTGWTGYEFDKISRIMKHRPGEVLLNYMFDFINRFTAWDNPKIAASFDGILGKDWKARIEASPLARDEAVQAIFAEEFKKAGNFTYVLSTPIEKLADRTHFCIVYGSRNVKGLEAYREVEYSAMKEHGMRRLEAKQALQEEKSGQTSMFAVSALHTVPPIDHQVAEYREQAKVWLQDELKENARAFPFSQVWPPMLETFMLRRTDARKVCAELGKDGIIPETWKAGGSKRKTPDETDMIGLVETVIIPQISSVAAQAADPETLV